jgi:transcriptional regulator with XRE-family HTH domain
LGLKNTKRGDAAMIGRKIRDIRLHKSMSQADICVGICTKSMISQIENGRVSPSLDLLEKICERLGISVSDLYRSDEKDTEIDKRLTFIEELLVEKEYSRGLTELHTLLRSTQIKDHSYKYFQCIYLLGKSYYLIGEYKKSQNYLNEALAITVKHKYYKDEINVLNSLSALYSNAYNNQDLALKHLLDAYALTNKYAIDERLTIKILYNLARIYRYKKENEKAIHFVNRALSLCKKSGIYECAGHLSTIAGLINMANKKTQSAIDYFKKALKFYEFTDDYCSIAGTYINLSKVFFQRKCLCAGYRYYLEAKYLISKDFPQLNENLEELEIEIQTNYPHLRNCSIQQILALCDKDCKLPKQNSDITDWTPHTKNCQ